MSDSLRITRSPPSISTSVPAHFPNTTRSPILTSSGIIFPASSRPPGPTANTLGLDGLFLRGIRNDDAACGFFFRLYPLDHHLVVHWPETRITRPSQSCTLQR